MPTELVLPNILAIARRFASDAPIVNTPMEEKA